MTFYIYWCIRDITSLIGVEYYAGCFWLYFPSDEKDECFGHRHLMLFGRCFNSLMNNDPDAAVNF